MSRTLAAADLVFCANQEAAAILHRHGFTRPLPVLPAVGVDTEVFGPCPQRQHQATDAPVFGYVGRFVAEKGIDTLLHAFAKLRQTTMPQARLRLIGNGPQRSSLKLLATELDIADGVEFVAPMPPAQIAREMCNLDILILPSRTTSVWKEQLGRVLLEAMACGVPVVGSDSGAIPEVIGDAGCIFPEGDVAALATILGELATDPAFCADLSERGRQRVEARYSQRHLAEQTMAIYQQLLS